MIVDTAVYVGGRREQVDEGGRVAAHARCLGTEGAFLWVGLKDPTHEELAAIAADLGLHRLAVEDALAGNQRPKLDVYAAPGADRPERSGPASGEDPDEDGQEGHGDATGAGASLFVSLKPLDYVEATSDVETRELMLFVGEHFVVTVRRGEHSPLAGVRLALEEEPRRLGRGPVAVLHAVLDAVVDRYAEIEQELGTDLDELEEGVFAGDDQPGSGEIYALKREVQEVRRALVPLVDPLERLARTDVPCVPASARPFFADVLDHLARTVDHVESYERLLTDVLNAHLAQVGVRQSIDNRKISAWAAIGLVPTAIAGVYGMNFDHMPELRWEYGYPAALGLMVVSCVALHRAFKRSGWL